VTRPILPDSIVQTHLSDGWTLSTTPVGAFEKPSDIPSDTQQIAAFVPGTVAEALENAGLLDRNNPHPLDTQDAWYRLALKTDEPADVTLHLGGLATVAEVFLNDTLILSSESMFENHDVPVHLSGNDNLAICFRALAPHLARKGPRARWRPQMMNTQGLRLIRTTALGYMPGWCPEIHAVGPWRPISYSRPARQAIDDLVIRSELSEKGDGLLWIACKLQNRADTISIHCADHSLTLQQNDDGDIAGQLTIPSVAQWWPHTHGTPQLHHVTLKIDGETYPLGQTGFRRIEVDNGSDGNDIAIKINGERIFCRGAVWTNADIVRLPGARADYEPWLKLAADAGMNMIRIGGTMTYETPEFFKLCDELGLMVWQDLMFANFDYPAKDETFCEHVKTEVSQCLADTALSPSLTILCGGSEMQQQGAMLGLPETIWNGPLTQEILPELSTRRRPDVPFIANSPSGGALPFYPNAGVAHYYGVGAYCRPLDDARRANVRFAAECLAFANVPQQPTLDQHLSVPAVIDPTWKQRVPRDRSASWDFEDIREHYLTELYGVDPSRLRREDPSRYLDYSRAVTAEVMEATFAEWRRAGSSCNGALVWTLQDLMPGAGWGVIDAAGEPKPAWYGLKRAFRPVQLLLSDEGTNGLDIHVINEASSAQDFIVELACLRDGGQPVVTARRELHLAARQTTTIAATDLFGAFFDTTYAYRFGPPSHDVTVARLKNSTGDEVIADAFHFPLGRSRAMHAPEIEVHLLRNDKGNWCLKLQTDRLAQSVHVQVDNFRASDDWFHLAPGAAKTVELVARGGDDSLPSGEITTLSSKQTLRF
jgi:beta-mannosidase